MSLYVANCVLCVAQGRECMLRVWQNNVAHGNQTLQLPLVLRQDIIMHLSRRPPASNCQQAVALEGPQTRYTHHHPPVRVQHHAPLAGSVSAVACCRPHALLPPASPAAHRPESGSHQLPGAQQVTVRRPGQNPECLPCWHLLNPLRSPLPPLHPREPADCAQQTQTASPAAACAACPCPCPVVVAAAARGLAGAAVLLGCQV